MAFFTYDCRYGSITLTRYLDRKSDQIASLYIIIIKEVTIMLGQIVLIMEKFLETAIDECIETLKKRFLRPLISDYERKKNELYMK